MNVTVCRSASHVYTRLAAGHLLARANSLQQPVVRLQTHFRTFIRPSQKQQPLFRTHTNSTGQRYCSMSEPSEKKHKPSTNVVLYTYWRSSCSWRVRIVLNLKGIEFESRPVHLVKDGGEQFKEDYGKLNPSHQVPSLEIDGHFLCDSGAIIEYLEETRTSTRVLPNTAVLRANARELANIIACDTQPVQNLRVQLKVQELSNKENRFAFAKHFISRGFKAFEDKVKVTAGKYCIGDEVTIADVYLIPQIYNAHRLKVDMSQFPTILQIQKNLEALDAFKDAHPSKQVDAQV